MQRTLIALSILVATCSTTFLAHSTAAEEPSPPKATVNGTGPGWKTLGEADFVNVNCDPNTWTWNDGDVHCTGQPVGVIRSQSDLHQFRAGGRVAAPEVRRQLGLLRLGARESLEGLSPATCRTAGSRSRCSTTAIPSNTRSKPARRPTGSPPTATSFRSAVEDEAVSARRARRQAQLPHASSSARASASGTTTTSGPSTAKSGSGSTARKSPAATAAIPARATSASSPKARRSSSAICGSPICRENAGRHASIKSQGHAIKRGLVP